MMILTYVDHQGGIVLGPSFLGRNTEFASNFFPAKGRNLLQTFSAFGFMLCVFLLGVKMDPYMILNSGKKSVTIGVLAVFIPFGLSGFVAFILNRSLKLDPDVSSVLHYVVIMHSMTAFPNIACFLDELRILNSEIGRLASSSSIVCDACYFSIIAVKYFISLAAERSIRTSIGSFFSVCLLFGFIIFGIRPVAMWAIRQTPEGEPVKDIYIFAVLMVLLVCGFMGEVFGLNAFAPSFLLGLVIPDGPPLGAALVEKLDCFVSVLLMPAFYTACGLRMDIFAIQHYNNVAVIQFIVIVAIFGKIIGTILPPLVYRMPVRDAFSLGLIMTTKGIGELALLSYWKSKHVSKPQTLDMLKLLLELCILCYVIEVINLQ